MGKAVLKRLGLLLGTLLLVSALAFAAFSVIPGDPTGAVLGMEATDEQIAAFRAQQGLDPAGMAAVSQLAGRLPRRRFRPVL